MSDERRTEVLLNLQSWERRHLTLPPKSHNIETLFHGATVKISEDILLYRFHLGGRCNGLEKSLLTFHCFCAILFYKYIKNAMIKQADRDYKRPLRQRVYAGGCEHACGGI